MKRSALFPWEVKILSKHRPAEMGFFSCPQLVTGNFFTINIAPCSAGPVFNYLLVNADRRVSEESVHKESVHEESQRRVDGKSIDEKDAQMVFT